MSQAQADPTHDYEDEPVVAYGAPLAIGNAVASLVFGIIAVISGPGGWFFGLVAVITGHIARREVRQGIGRGDGLAVAGLILGYIGIVAGVAFILGQITSA